MTDFKDGDRIRATQGESVLVGEFRSWKGDDEYFDIYLGNDAQFAQLKTNEWTLELIQPTNQEILDAMKIGTRFKYHDSIGYWIKVTTNGYIYVTSTGSTTATNVYKSTDFGNHSVIVVVEDDA
jgi:hypothetical protein